MLALFSDFIRRHKGYIVMVLALVLVSGKMFSGSTAQENIQTKKNQHEMESFEKAEKNFQKKIRNPQALQSFFKERPILKRAVSICLVFFVGLLTLGFILNVLILFYPEFRRKISVVWTTGNDLWSFSLLSKIFLWVLTFSFFWIFLLSLVRRFVAPGLSENFCMIIHAILLNVSTFFILKILLEKQGGSLSDLGFRVPSKSVLKEVLAGLAGYAAVTPIFLLILAALAMLSEYFHYDPDPHPLVYMFLDSQSSKLLIYLSLFTAIVIAPIMEELLFRGVCYQVFRKKFGALYAGIISASIFAVVHGSSFAFWPIYVLGLALAYVYETRKTILAPMILHMTHNVVFIGYFFILKQMILRGGS